MISVIVCTYNRSESLQLTLKSLETLQPPAGDTWELILVDNNSTDDTRQVVENFAQSTRLCVRYVLETRQGLSFARNTGIENAHGSLIVFTDDDVTVQPDWLAELAAAFRNSDCMAIGGKIISVWPCPRPKWFQESGPFATAKAIVSFDLGDETRPIQTDPYGANMAFRREAFTKYGMFRTDLGRIGTALMGGEDTEFFRRLHKAGETVLYVATAVVFHPVSKERTGRKYFESWCFNAARSQVRLDGVSENAVCYFGIPRYLFRDLAESLFRWMVMPGAARRFYYKLRVCILAGTMAEIWKMRRLGLPIPVQQHHASRPVQS